jgi:hypothetical protein
MARGCCACASRAAAPLCTWQRVAGHRLQARDLVHGGDAHQPSRAVAPHHLVEAASGKSKGGAAMWHTARITMCEQAVTTPADTCMYLLLVAAHKKKCWI